MTKKHRVGLGHRLSFAAVLLLAGCASQPAYEWSVPPQPESASGYTEKPGWFSKKFMVAAANPLATEAGYEILREGGSAVDAAIAVQMVLTLAEPQSSGIGGGAFLVHFNGKAVETYDGRETAPAAATPDLFIGKDGKPLSFNAGMVGGRSVGTPGVLRALELAHREHGKLPWKRLFARAIWLAEQGFAVSPRLNTLIAADPLLRDDPVAARYFFTPDGKAWPVGHLLKNPQLAETLRAIADNGVEAFYSGAIAADIVAKVRGHATNPGTMEARDLTQYRAKKRAPLCFDYKLYRVCGMAPPSSGTLALGQMLGMLEGSQLAEFAPKDGVPQAQAVHLMSEAGRLAFADRGLYVADPDFVPLPGGLLDRAYLESRARLIADKSMGRAQAGVPSGARAAYGHDRSPELPATSHISIVDAHGNALSMTTTIEAVFGSRQMVRGFLLNNELTDFSFEPTDNGKPVANRVEGGKRPRSSMSPVLVFDKESGEMLMSGGSPGGSAIINYVAKLLVGTLDWGMTVQQAIALPNFGSRNGPTELETGRAPPALVEALKVRGHDVRVIDQTSGLQGIQRMEIHGIKGWFGGADPRREGIARGD
jgi:gamma-glutamyltranspeptidase / glutathione hydrolase